MARKLKKDSKVWIEFEQDKEIKFLLKPFTVLYLTKIPTETNYTPETLWEIFNNSVCDWSGITDENDKPIKCTLENKRLFAEQDYEILMWVVLESSRLNTKKDIELKN